MVTIDSPHKHENRVDDELEEEEAEEDGTSDNRAAIIRGAA